jgi:6,7-dimethyl-8-ribityllumazine synthase
MQGADKGYIAHEGGKGLRIAFVQARFNQGITDTLAQSCKEELIRLGVTEADIDHHFVPGALEIPLALKALAARGSHDALVALGCVIRGETYHFELVANESAAGVTRVGLDHQIPIANVILTTDNLAQALARQVEKGVDAAQVVVEMAQLLRELKR